MRTVLAIGLVTMWLAGDAAGQTIQTTPDGQPDVQGVWRPILPGTHSLNPAKSSNSDFAERVSGVVKESPSRIIDPPDGAIPYQPWAAALQKQQAVDFEHPTRPEHMDTAT